MKKIVLSVAAIVAAAAIAQAASIVNSRHDMNAAGYDTTQTEICIFCHTPHNPIVQVPLWNRYNPSTTGWTFYNSPTLTSVSKNAKFETDSISLFCLSCHDGQTAIGAYVNEPVANTANADTINTRPALGTGNFISTLYANIGGGNKNLTNDHPVGFSYSAAQAQDTASATGGLNSIDTVKSKFGITDSTYNPFYVAGGVQNQMECASCHKVHDPGTSRNFLRIENGESALCLACHNK